MALTVSELVVLGLLVEQPRHGYELEQTIARRGIRQWASLAFSSIYYVLSKLEERGLVQSRETAGPRSRRVFTATEAGRAAASAAALELMETPAPPLSPLAVALANAPLIAPAELAAGIRDRIAALDGQRAGIRAAQDAQGPLPRPAELVFSYSLAMLDAERAWLAARLEEEDA